MDERDRELIALHYGADLTAREIGRVLGMRTNAVDVALHRCRKRLRGELERVGEAPSVRPSLLPLPGSRGESALSHERIPDLVRELVITIG